MNLISPLDKNIYRTMIIDGDRPAMVYFRGSDGSIDWWSTSSIDATSKQLERAYKALNETHDNVEITDHWRDDWAARAAFKLLRKKYIEDPDERENLLADNPEFHEEFSYFYDVCCFAVAEKDRVFYKALGYNDAVEEIEIKTKRPEYYASPFNSRHLSLLRKLGVLIPVSLLVAGCIGQKESIPDEEDSEGGSALQKALEQNYMSELGVDPNSDIGIAIMGIDDDSYTNVFEEALMKLSLTDPDGVNDAIDGYKLLPLINQQRILTSFNERDILSLSSYKKMPDTLKEMLLYESLPEEIQKEISHPISKEIRLYDINGDGTIGDEEINKLFSEKSSIGEDVWDDLLFHLKIYDLFPNLYPDYLNKDLGDIIRIYLGEKFHPDILYKLEGNDLFGKTLEEPEKEEIDTFLANPDVEDILSQTSDGFQINFIPEVLGMDPQKRGYVIDWLHETMNEFPTQTFPVGYFNPKKPSPGYMIDIQIIPLDANGFSNAGCILYDQPENNDLILLDLNAIKGNIVDGKIDAIFPIDKIYSTELSVVDYLNFREMETSWYLTLPNIERVEGNENNIFYSQFLIGKKWFPLHHIRYGKEGYQDSSSITQFTEEAYTTIVYDEDDRKIRGEPFLYSVDVSFTEDYKGGEYTRQGISIFFDEKLKVVASQWHPLSSFSGDHPDAEGRIDIFKRYAKDLFDAVTKNNFFGTSFLKWLKKRGLYLFKQN